MEESERLETLDSEKLTNELYEYVEGLHGDEYFEQYISEIQRRLKLLDEFQELEKVRRTW